MCGTARWPRRANVAKLDQMLEWYPNDHKHAMMTFVLLAIMDVIIVAMIAAAVFSTKACSV